MDAPGDQPRQDYVISPSLVPLEQIVPRAKVKYMGWAQMILGLILVFSEVSHFCGPSPGYVS